MLYKMLFLWAFIQAYSKHYKVLRLLCNVIHFFSKALINIMSTGFVRCVIVKHNDSNSSPGGYKYCKMHVFGEYQFEKF